jgi:hypothetical protein
MTFEAAFEIISRLDWARAGSETPAVPWDLNPVAVGAIASSISALITALALVVAVGTYLNNSRATARSQAALVTAYRTRSRERRIMGDVEHHLIEIQITNASDTNIFDLSLLLQSSLLLQRNAHPYDPPIDWASRKLTGTWSRSWGRWTLCDGAVIPPGISTLRFFISADQLGPLLPIWLHVAVGFVDRNGRAWTRRLDGKLIEGWKMS